MLTNPRLYPTIVIVLIMLAAVNYFLQGDPRRGMFWFAQAVALCSLTY